VLKKQGFSQSPHDPCVYWKDVAGDRIYLVTYVDDFIWLSKNRGLIDAELAEFGKNFEISVLGDVEWALGMRVRRSKGKVTIDQATSVTRILEKYGMANCNPVASPLEPGIKYTKEMCPKTTEERSEMAGEPYLNLLGELIYVAYATRPDIAAAVGILAQFATNPGKQHWLGLKRILRYLKGTITYALTYTSSGGGKGREITGYSDSDYANDTDDRKSRTGWVFVQNGAAISWKSQKQTLIALSASEAETYALVEAMREGTNWYHRLKAIGEEPTKPIMVRCDNAGSELMVERAPGSRDSTKHIDVRHIWIRDIQERGIVTKTHVPTKENAADVFTKALNGPSTEAARRMIGLYPLEEP
jgi:hypothetical protein